MSLIKAAAIGFIGILIGFMLTRPTGNTSTISEAEVLEKKLSEVKNNLMGFTAYETYLTATKSNLESQAKLITGKVVRQERMTTAADQALMPWIKTRTVVEITYQAEYSFGFNLSPNRYNIRQAKDGKGIEILVGAPTMLTIPGTNKYGYRVLSEEPFADGGKALNRLFQQVPIWANENGKKMTTTPEIKALCEKALIDFVRGFLQKQPNVKSVPQITIVYSN